MSGHSHFVRKHCGVVKLSGLRKMLLATTASAVMELLRLKFEDYQYERRRVNGDVAMLEEGRGYL